ncbi:hypothetical protein RCOM_0265760 [Ricinus communis]|uniref:Polymerase/histidinol phosphatase N-terminal domain-containing protein n=1 Tax=Ricinus communis TaxID=3988 RepID=B9SWA5_RICCO|nr:hypothetical protein RCOM_0265760 [Ricinus communis]
MVDDPFATKDNNNSNNNNNTKRPKDDSNNNNKKKKKKKKRGGTKKKMTAEQTLAFKAVTEWVYLEQQQQQQPCPLVSSASYVVDDFGVQKAKIVEKVVFELHSHSKFSDGFLSPSKLVERAHGNGVKVLALTDHDTMAGIPEAIEAARRFGIKIIPGVEISTIYSPSDLADVYGLLKLGGSDYHGRGGNSESEVGSVNLPVLALQDFLKVARPVWCGAIRDILENYAEEPSDSNLARIARFGRTRVLKGTSTMSCGADLIERCLSLWLTNEERQNAGFEAIKLKLSHISINQGGIHVPIESK